MSEHLLDAMSDGLVDGGVVVCEGAGSCGGDKAGFAAGH
jgi:hypothetical protein